MTNRRNAPAQNNDQGTDKGGGSLPQWTVAVAREGQGQTYWTTIGAGWNAQGGGISVNLDAHPIGNRIMIFPRKTEEEREAANKNRDSRSNRP